MSTESIQKLIETIMAAESSKKPFVIEFDNNISVILSAEEASIFKSDLDHFDYSDFFYCSKMIELIRLASVKTPLQEYIAGEEDLKTYMEDVVCYLWESANDSTKEYISNNVKEYFAKNMPATLKFMESNKISPDIGIEIMEYCGNNAFSKEIKKLNKIINALPYYANELMPAFTKMVRHALRTNVCNDLLHL